MENNRVIIKTGTKVILKSTKQNGIVSDAWDPYLVNPSVYSKNTPIGYNIVTEDGISHICIGDDFEIGIKVV